MCTSRTWFQEEDVSEPKKNPRAKHEDHSCDELIMSEYRRGMSCVNISISNNIPYSRVYSVIRKNTNATIEIKV